MTKHLLLMCAATFALVGCGETKILGKSLPDETQVVDGPSLALPPSYELRPPREAADSAGYESTLNAAKTKEAQALIAGTAEEAKPAAAAVPAADAWILEQAAKQGNITADPNVRKELDATATEEQKEEKNQSGFWTRWFGKDE